MYYHTILIYAVFCIIVFWCFRLYKSIWRFASYSELLRMICKYGNSISLKLQSNRSHNAAKYDKITARKSYAISKKVTTFQCSIFFFVLLNFSLICFSPIISSYMYYDGKYIKLAGRINLQSEFNLIKTQLLSYSQTSFLYPRFL